MLYPRLKYGHQPQIREAGVVWFGPWIPGVATEIADELGLVGWMCERLDGSRTSEELLAEAAEAFPGDLTAEDAGELLDFLVGSGWVQDASAVPPPQLTARDVERHRRGIEYLDSVNVDPETDGYRLQAALKASRVSVLGVGGVGSAVAANLAASGIGELHLVDHDVVELSNLGRQLLFTESDLGRNKVEATVARLRALNGDIQISGTDRLLDGAGPIAEAIAGSDAVVLCADRPRAHIRSWANEAAFGLRIPWLHAAYSGFEFTMATYIPGRTECGDCYEAHTRDLARSRGFAPARPDEGDDNPVTAASAQITGHYLALETIHLLLGLPVQTAGRLLARYLIDYGHHSFSEAPPRPDCPVGCGALITA